MKLSIETTPSEPNCIDLSDHFKAEYLQYAIEHYRSDCRISKYNQPCQLEFLVAEINIHVFQKVAKWLDEHGLIGHDFDDIRKLLLSFIDKECDSLLPWTVSRIRPGKHKLESRDDLLYKDADNKITLNPSRETTMWICDVHEAWSVLVNNPTSNE